MALLKTFNTSGQSSSGQMKIMARRCVNAWSK